MDLARLKSLLGFSEKEVPMREPLSDSAMREINDPESMVGRLMSTSPEMLKVPSSAYNKKRNQPSNTLVYDADLSKEKTIGALQGDPIGSMGVFGKFSNRSISSEDAFLEGDMLSGESLKRSAFNAGYIPPNSDIFDDYVGSSEYYKKILDVNPEQRIADQSEASYSPSKNRVTIPLDLFDSWIKTKSPDDQDNLVNSLVHELKHAEDTKKKRVDGPGHFSGEDARYGQAVSGRNYINRYAALKRLMELK
jgi:hypothetical protein